MKRVLYYLLLCIVLFSCSKESKLELNTTTVSLYSGDEHFITTINGTNVTFESQNPYIATVNSTTGEVTAMTIGSTIIDVFSDQGTAQVFVTVVPLYNTFKEPYRDFTMTKSQIISACGTPDSETQDGIVYFHGADRTHVADMYNFSNNLLSGSIAVIHQDAAVEAMKFLLERYVPLGSKDEMYIFANGISSDTITMGVSLSKLSGYKLYVVIYLPYTDDTRSSYKELEVESIINSFDIARFEHYKE